MKIMYCTDIHGSKKRYKKILNIHEKFDLTIIGGDILPKNIYYGNIWEIQESFIKDFFPKYFDEFKTPLIIDFGNDDHECNYLDFINLVLKYDHVYNIHLKESIINNISFIGMNNVPDYPFGLKDWCRKDNDEYIIDSKQLGIPCTSTKKGYKNINNLKKHYNQRLSIEKILDTLLPSSMSEECIYLFHSPPRMLGLDVCLRGECVGSRAITNWILKNNPKILFSGHIHESPEVSGKYFNKLENTLCIQPGQSYKSNELTYCSFYLNDVEKTLKRETI